MKAILGLLIVLSIFSDNNGITSIATANKHKSAAEDAFKAKDYKTAIGEYSILLDSLGVQDDAAMLDLAHSYFLSEDAENATKRYASIQNSGNKKIASIANQQLGIIKAQEKKIEEALKFMKAAIKHDPENMAARYDYEMLLKQKKEQDKQDQQNQDQNQDKENKEDQKDKDENKDENKEDQENKDKNDQGDNGDKDENKDNQDEQKSEEGNPDQQDKQDGEQGEETEQEREEREKAEEQEQFNQRMQDIKMPANQAQMILDALKNKEVQYFQQQKKKSKNRDRNKPDW